MCFTGGEYPVFAPIDAGVTTPAYKCVTQGSRAQSCPLVLTVEEAEWDRNRLVDSEVDH